MAIASMIIQPAAGSESKVREALSCLDGVAVHATTPKQEIIIVIEAVSLDAVNLAARTIETVPGVLGVFPTYVTTEDEQEDG